MLRSFRKEAESQLEVGKKLSAMFVKLFIKKLAFYNLAEF